jgi:uncharacterized protein YndB with AHSA1/START domain
LAKPAPMHAREADIHISAPVEKVYATLADLDRMGEWSPECKRITWIEPPDPLASGARFKGHNQRGRLTRWTTSCLIIAAEAGKELSWEVYWRGRVETRWRYAMSPEQGGTRLRESFEVVWIPIEIKLQQVLSGGTGRRMDALEHGMRQTLQGIKGAVETGA